MSKNGKKSKEKASRSINEVDYNNVPSSKRERRTDLLQDMWILSFVFQ